jgi:hypothetical protein
LGSAAPKPGETSASPLREDVADKRCTFEKFRAKMEAELAKD